MGPSPNAMSRFRNLRYSSMVFRSHPIRCSMWCSTHSATVTLLPLAARGAAARSWAASALPGPTRPTSSLNFPAWVGGVETQGTLAAIVPEQHLPKRRAVFAGTWAHARHGLSPLDSCWIAILGGSQVL